MASDILGCHRGVFRYSDDRFVVRFFHVPESRTRAGGKSVRIRRHPFLG